MFESIDTHAIYTILAWSFGSTAVGLFCGFCIGRWFTLANEPRKLRIDRERTLRALTTLLTSTDKLNEDVDSHNAALHEAEKDISQLQMEGSEQFDSIQSKLLTDIATVVESNRKLESELVVSRYQLEQQAQELDKRKLEARTDALCRTGNRKAFDEAIQFMLSRHGSVGTSFALMLIDVDKFKRINDTFGHSAGDNVLINIGNALKECVRPGDVVCRLGGDEFAILLNNTSDKEVKLVGSRIRQTIETLDFEVGDESQTTVVTMSMGLTAVRLLDTAESLYDRADQALYESKQLGRNRLTTRLENPEEDERKEEEAPRKTYAEIKAELLEGEKI